MSRDPLTALREVAQHHREQASRGLFSKEASKHNGRATAIERWLPVLEKMHAYIAARAAFRDAPTEPWGTWRDAQAAESRALSELFEAIHALHPIAEETAADGR